MGSFSGMHSSNAYEFMRQRNMPQPPVEPEKSLADEVARLADAVEELVYWVRPMTGDLVTGKAAVEEYEKLTQGGEYGKR